MISKLPKKMLETLDQMYRYGQENQPLPENVEARSLAEKMWMAGQYNRLQREGIAPPMPPKHNKRIGNHLLRKRDKSDANMYCWNGRHWDDNKRTMSPCSAFCPACRNECPKENWEDSPGNRQIQAKWRRQLEANRRRKEKLDQKKALDAGEQWSDV
jgi:hypothetical protein